MLGGVAGAVPALVAAGVPVDAQLTAPQLLPKNYGEKRSPEAAPAGSTALTLACAVGKPASVQALLAAGAAYQLPTLASNTTHLWELVADGGSSPWHWAAKRSHPLRTEHEAAAAAAVRASLLSDVLQRAAAGTGPEFVPEQLMALLLAAALAPANVDQLTALAALPETGGMLGADQRRRLAGLVVEHGDAAAVQALQAGPLRQHPIDPDGRMLYSIARRRGADVLLLARALLQVREAAAESELVLAGTKP